MIINNDGGVTLTREEAIVIFRTIGDTSYESRQRGSAMLSPNESDTVNAVYVTYAMHEIEARRDR